MSLHWPVAHCDCHHPAPDYAYMDAIEAAEARFQPLTDALTERLGLDVEPVVDQTGGMVMCLAIHWPDDAYVWVSDYWWMRDDLVLGLYDSDEDEGTCPEPPAALLDLLDGEDYKAPHPPQFVIDRIADWMAPYITAHGAAHGWVSRASKGGQS